jgi:hypothetical protein
MGWIVAKPVVGRGHPLAGQVVTDMLSAVLPGFTGLRLHRLNNAPLYCNHLVARSSSRGVCRAMTGVNGRERHRNQLLRCTPELCRVSYIPTLLGTFEG